MDTFKLLDNYIKDRTGNIGPFPDIVQKGINTIAGEIPFKLKLAITLAELITFSSHLRKPIKLYDGTLVPTNAIVFALAGSGMSKDKSLNTIRKSLDMGYMQIKDERREYAKVKAENKAKLEGKGKHEWKMFYVEPKPLQAGLGTVEGLLHHFADIGQNPLGSGSITTSEIGSELQTNGAMTDIIKIISQAYDLGNVAPKIVKSSENQTQAIKGLPVNALFFGSQEALLFNNEIKSKFKLVFNTQLARRSIFTFTPEVPTRLEISSIDELYKLKEKERERVLAAQEALSHLTSGLVETTTQEPLTLTPEATKLFDVYLEYNNFISDDQSNKYPISKLSRKHKQWLALKLAGTYAILHGREFVNEEMYAYAINTVELLAPQLSEFEKELVKEPYEQLADMCSYKAEDSSFFLSLHELRKLSYVTGAGSSKSKVEELAKLANSYDEGGRYTVHENGIQYDEQIITDEIGVSCIFFEDTDLKGEELKEYMARNCKDGFDVYDTDFAEMRDMLKNNAAYGPFVFADGKRGKDNVQGGTKFVVLDIDKSYITDEEVHVLLNEYNHYVARTSDPENEFKFRVLLELDSIVDIEPQLWKAFIQEIGKELGLVVDSLPQSQIFFSFADRNILEQLDGSTLKTKYLLENASECLRNKPKLPSELPPKEKNNKLADPRETFSFAFTAEPGERSILLYRALAYAIDLGADEEYIEKLAHEVNDYWMESMDKDRLKRTLITPALRRV